jgi:hypothetical protein
VLDFTLLGSAVSLRAYTRPGSPFSASGFTRLPGSNERRGGGVSLRHPPANGVGNVVFLSGLLFLRDVMSS